RALKTRGNTPKYGLIFHSSFIGRASAKNKGRMARYLANKCSIASRIDCFSENGTSAFGDKLREQVEERLDFYDKGVAPRKNIDVMKSAIESADNNDTEMQTEEVSAKKTKKRKQKATEDDMAVDKAEETTNGDVEHKSEKKKKKKEKRKLDQEVEVQEQVVDDGANGESGKKKKKKSKRKDTE
ncbi:nucleolar protein 56-like, partial [Trifolium pratense]